MIPINNQAPSSSFSNINNKIPTSPSLMIDQWEKWAKQAQLGRGEQREVALLRLKDCLEHQKPILELSNLNLTKLPATLPDHIDTLNLMNNNLTHLPERLPDGLKELIVNGNQLTHLPETLPTKLKLLHVDTNYLTSLSETLPSELKKIYANHNQLTYLPEILPMELRELHVNNNQLTHLPEALPMDLLELHANHNRLISLPEALPSGLKEIDVDGNQLTHLPDRLSFGLRSLFVSDNLLAQLPESLPHGLNHLFVSNNRLTSLSGSLPSGLREIHAYNNQLTRLPEPLPVRLRSLLISHNHLTQFYEPLPAGLVELDVSNNHLNFLPEPLPAGLRLMIFSNNPFINPPAAWDFSSLSAPSSVPHLIETLSLWDQQEGDIIRWKEIAQEKNAGHFSQFLNKLHDQRNASSTDLHRIVSEWLRELAKEENRDVRAQTFAIAHLGTESCIDRASYYFNQMHSLLIEHRLTKPSVSISEIINTLRSLFRLQELEKISASHIKQHRQTSPAFMEDIEIYLAYQYKLREELDLSVYTELQFETVANLTETDLRRAKSQILDKEKQEFLRHLVNHSEVWQKKIEAWDGEKWTLANERYLDEIASADFKRAVRGALKKEGISSVDEDAVRIMQQTMAYDVLSRIRYSLTEAFLKEHNALSLIESYDKPFKDI